MKLLFFYLLNFFLLSFFLAPFTAIASDENHLTKQNIDFYLQDKLIATLPLSEILQWKEYVPYLKSGSQDYQATLENIHFCSLDKIFCDSILSTRNNIHQRKFYVKKINQNEIKKFLIKLAHENDKEPKDAKFEIVDEKVTSFQISQEGTKLDIEKNIKIITQIINQVNIPQKINLAYNIVKPQVDSSDVNNLKIDKLIGEGISDFKGSTRSRIHNIHTAVQRFQGHLIKPGEEFSFIKTLGQVDGENGYLPELVIKHNVTKPEFGGGICQVSTTTFRAAIYSGLKITERHPHAYPVHYYNPQGMDATVYIPRPDLRFINNTPGYILIQTKFEGTHLIFQFYGQDDGRKVEVKGPFVTARGAGGSMKTYFTQKVFDKNGNLIIDDIFRSNYASPNRYPHPGQQTIITKKPKDWSKKEWKNYKKAHNL